MQNGGCGFVLRPNFMFEDSYNPYEPPDAKQAVSLGIRVLAARFEFSNGYYQSLSRWISIFHVGI